MLNFGPVLIVLCARILSGLLLLFLLLSLTACASVGTAVPWTPCVHPEIDPTTQGGLSQAVLAYQEEVDRCNALNGAE